MIIRNANLSEIKLELSEIELEDLKIVPHLTTSTMLTIEINCDLVPITTALSLCSEEEAMHCLRRLALIIGEMILFKGIFPRRRFYFP